MDKVFIAGAVASRTQVLLPLIATFAYNNAAVVVAAAVASVVVCFHF